MRRGVATVYLAGTFFFAALSWVQAEPTTQWTLAPDSLAGHRQRVRCILEVEGQLAPASPKPVPLEVEAEMYYREEFLEASSEARHAARRYITAEAAIRINNRQQRRTLPNDLRQLVCSRKSNGYQFHSLADPLSRDLVDLIDLPGNSLDLDGWLGERPVAVGQTWSIPNGTAARLLGLDSITDGQLTGRLVSVEAEQAQVTVEGLLKGQARGAETELRVEAKLSVHTGERRVRWLALGIGETRQAGPVGPGLKAQARLRMVLGPDNDPPLTADPEQAERFAAKLDEPSPVLRLDAQNGTLQLLHPYAWFPISDRGDPIVLRQLTDGKPLAQCTISRLGRLPAGRELSLEEFCQDIRSALAGRMQQIVDTQESTSAQGLRMLRVVVVGEVEKAPIQWIYYHLSSPEGDRAAVVFTHQASENDVLGGSDLTIANSLRFLAPADSQAGDHPEPPRQTRRPQSQGPKLR